MNDNRFGPNDPPSNLVVLPVAEGMQRERVSEERLLDQPDPLQGWFEASGQDAAADDRLRRFVDGLLGDMPVEVGASVPDEPIPTDEPSTLDDEGPSTLQIRQARQQRRLAVQPLVLAHWFDAAADGGAADRRLRAFAAQQLRSPATPRPSHVRPWMGLAIAACALLAIGVAGWMGRTPGEPSQPALSLDAGSLAATPTLQPLAEAPLPPAPLPAPVQADPQQQASLPTPQAPAPLPPSAPEVDRLELAVDEAPQVAIIVEVPAPPVAVELSPVAAPTSPPLSTAGEIDASAVAWRGTVVPGLDLRVDQGFAILGGTEAEPVLNLASDSAVRVDLDRSAVDQGFNTFTIQTSSGTVRVLGTRYTVQTPSGRTEVSTRRGLVQLECQDGRRKLVAAGQSESCEAQADARLLVHMQALDRPDLPDEVRLSEAEQYNYLQEKLLQSSPEAFVATADLMLSRALSSAGLRRVIEAVRVDALCAMGWNGPARRAATNWLESEGTVGRERLSTIAEAGCSEG